MLKLLLYNYQQTARYYTIYRTFKQWSSDDFKTILRLFVGRNYDYFRTCYDYSSRNATTIACPYWLSGESPKRETAVAVNGSAPPAAGLPRRVEGARLTRCALVADRCQIASRRAWEVSRLCRADPVQVETLTPPPLAWSAICCTVWHGSTAGRTPAPPYIHYYNRRLCWPV